MLFGLLLRYAIAYTKEISLCSDMLELIHCLCYLQEPGFESNLVRPGQFFACYKVSPLKTIKTQRQNLCHVPHLSSPKLSGVACKTSKQKKNTKYHTNVNVTQSRRNIIWYNLLPAGTLPPDLLQNYQKKISYW